MAFISWNAFCPGHLTTWPSQNDCAIDTATIETSTGLQRVRWYLLKLLRFGGKFLPGNSQTILAVDERAGRGHITFDDLIKNTLGTLAWINSTLNIPDFLILCSHFSAVESRMEHDNREPLGTKFFSQQSPGNVAVSQGNTEINNSIKG